MNEPIDPSTPSQTSSTNAKKKSPLLWVALGCVGILVLAAIGITAGGFFVAKKVKDTLEDGNPAIAAAKLMVRANPELELVSSDEEAGTMTIRKKDTGEEFTVDWHDIANGNLSFTSGDEKVEIQGGAAEDDGSFTIKSGNESSEITFGSDAAKDLPSWIPLYPGTAPTGTYSARTAGGLSGTFTLSTSDSVSKVIAFYEAHFESAEFKVEKTIFTSPTGETGILSISSESSETGQISVNRQDDETQIVASYSDVP